MRKDFTVSFIGAGNMGEAMLRGLVASGFSPKKLIAFDVNKARLKEVSSRYKIKAAKSLADTLSAEVAVVAVKPNVVPEVVAEMNAAGVLPGLLLSIAAGVPIKTYRSALAGKAKVIRAMPNTPGLIGKGVSVFCPGPGCGRKEMDRARAVLGALGAVFQVKDESLLDAVTGLSGSGPAYVFAAVEALADGGVKMGLSRDLALKLAAHTVFGAAAMVIETGEHPAALKDKVASPGGTTICGLAELEKKGFRAALMSAVEAATLRSRELGNLSDEET